MAITDLRCARTYNRGNDRGRHVQIHKSKRQIAIGRNKGRDTATGTLTGSGFDIQEQTSVGPFASSETVTAEIPLAAYVHGCVYLASGR